MLLVYHFVFLFLFLLLLLLIKLQTLSGDDAPGVDVLGKQISDFDSHTRTWGRREVNLVRNSSVKLTTSVKAPLNSTNLSFMLLLEKFGCFGKQQSILLPILQRFLPLSALNTLRGISSHSLSTWRCQESSSTNRSF